MGNKNIWEERGYIEVRPGVYERPAENYERKNPTLPDKPEPTSPVIQKYKAMRKKRTAVHAKGNKSKIREDHIKSQTTVLLNFRLTDNRTHDLDGMGSTLLDCLRHAGIITDDSTRFVQRIICRFEMSKTPGVDIVIIDFNEEKIN